MNNNHYDSIFVRGPLCFLCFVITEHITSKKAEGGRRQMIRKFRQPKKTNEGKTACLLKSYHEILSDTKF